MPRLHPPLPEARWARSPEDARLLVEEVRRELAENPGRLSVDTETVTGDDDADVDEVQALTATPVFVGLSPPPYLNRYGFFIQDPEVLEIVRPLLEDPTLEKTLHNASYDVLACQNIGLTLAGRISDTFLKDWLLYGEERFGEHDLKSCARDFFGIPMPTYAEVFRNPHIPPATGRVSDFPDDVVADYGALDPLAGGRLDLHHSGKLSAVNLSVDGSPIGGMQTLEDYYWSVEEPHLQTLIGMERRGTRLDVPFLQQTSMKLQQTEEQNLSEVYRLLGRTINVQSPPQMVDLLYRELGFTPTRRTKSKQGWSADGDAFDDCRLEAKRWVEEGKIPPDDVRVLVLDHIEEAKDCQKTRSTFVDGMLSRMDLAGYIHTHYNPVIATGRLSSQRPNLQNLKNPAKDRTWQIRRAWIAPDDEVLICADWAQVEVRLAAAWSEDPAMLAAIEAGHDLHSASAARGLGISYEEFCQRKEAKDKLVVETRTAYKTVMFGWIYRAGDETLAKQMSKALDRLVLVEEAAAFRAQMEGLYPRLVDWMEDLWAWVQKVGYVSTILGRKRFLPNANHPREYIRESAKRRAINTPIQGSAADLMKAALLTIDRDEELRAMGYKARLQVHDEVVGSAPERHAKAAAARVKEIMMDPLGPWGLGLNTRLDVDVQIVPCWYDAK